MSANGNDTSASRTTQPPVTKEKKLRQRALANRCRNRLLSIRYDVEHFCRPTVNRPQLRDFPLIANERCGSWYAYPLMRDCPATCYFKSTDGHVGTWNFSLKRLNLSVLRAVTLHQRGCVILDASASKELPDSFSRTIPIWAAVMNRIAARYRQELGIPAPPQCQWDFDVYTPSFAVSPEERDEIRNLIDSRVEALYRSKAIVDPLWLASTLMKPLRAYWITPLHVDAPTIFPVDCYSIVCVNCSESKPHCTVLEGSASFLYTAGAADDHESWARRLNPPLFWDNCCAILDDPGMAEDETDIAIDSVVQKEVEANDSFEKDFGMSQARPFALIGCTNIFVGTRTSGRPPECWEHFDAILT